MISVTANGSNVQSSIVEFTADELNDINNLPTNVGQGSTCLVIEDSSVWMLSSDKTWHEI